MISAPIRRGGSFLPAFINNSECTNENPQGQHNKGTKENANHDCPNSEGS